MKFYTLTSERGTFPNFQCLRADYVDSKDGKKYWLNPGPFEREEWDRNLLHASDIGDCPRKVAYRLTGAPEKPRARTTLANKRLMFNAGHDWHALDASALNWAGLLVGHEIALDLGEGWAGRCDVLFKPDYRSEKVLGKDTKTVLPNMLAYHRMDTPKPKDCTQVAVYAGPTEIDEWLIEYTDRAGANTPEVCKVTAGKWVDSMLAARLALADARDALPEMPPVIEKGQYQGHYSKAKPGEVSRLTKVTYETDYRCRYCDYHSTQTEKRTNPSSGRQKEHSWTLADSLCKPFNDPELTVAEWKGGALVKMLDAHADGVAAFLDSHVKEYREEPEDD